MSRIGDIYSYFVTWLALQQICDNPNDSEATLLNTGQPIVCTGIKTDDITASKHSNQHWVCSDTWTHKRSYLTLDKNE